MSADKQPLSDQVFRQVLTLLRQERQYGRQIIDESGIKPRQVSVLRFLLETGPVTVGQVQDYIQNSPSTTSTLIAQLEEAGYVTRTRSMADNRVVIVKPTEQGRDVVQKVPFVGLPLLRRQLGGLG